LEGRLAHAFDRSGHTVVKLLIFVIRPKALVKERGHMNKIDLIKTLSTTTDISKSEATKIVNLFFEQMVVALEKGDRVEIRGLCSFYAKEYEG
jgi:hypothetical protein